MLDLPRLYRHFRSGFSAHNSRQMHFERRVSNGITLLGSPFKSKSKLSLGTRHADGYGTNISDYGYPTPRRRSIDIAVTHAKES